MDNVEKIDLEKVLTEAFKKGRKKKPEPVSLLTTAMVLCLTLAAVVVLTKSLEK